MGSTGIVYWNDNLVSKMTPIEIGFFLLHETQGIGKLSFKNDGPFGPFFFRTLRSSKRASVQHRQEAKSLPNVTSEP
jgi:hypothetical protein